jgi:hypothetical protein
MSLMFSQDPKYYDGGRAATRCWVGAMKVLVEHYLRDEFNSEEEMKEFMDLVQADYENPNYHLYSIVYFRLYNSYANLDILLPEESPQSNDKNQGGMICF